jgi:hypothetical protein
VNGKRVWTKLCSSPTHLETLKQQVSDLVASVATR